MKPAIVRFKEKFLVEDCWRWTGARNSSGYGNFKLTTGKVVSAHRFMYEYIKGHISNGMQIDHLCRHRWCVNPDHMEVVTPKENSRRGISHSGNRKSVNVCREGHSDWFLQGKSRRCRPCYNEYMRQFRRSR